MEIGVYTFVENTPDPATGQTLPATQRLRDLMEEVELADQVGLEVFGIGEHHRPDFLGSAPTIMLAAAAERTKTIRLSTAVTVLSSDDPVRVYEQFSTLDLLSGGRAEIMAGRGSFIESFPLFGYDLNDYDTLFGEKLELLLHIRDNERVTWQGQHRAPLQDQGDLSAHAEQDPDLGRGRRQSAVGDPRRLAQSADGARHHRRHAGALRAVRQSVPPGREPCRPRRRQAAGRHQHPRLCGGHLASRRRRVLPELCRADDAYRPRARLAADHARAFRRRPLGCAAISRSARRSR